MLQTIDQVLSNEKSDFNDYMSCFKKIKEQGNVVVIKFDGGRTETQYTVFISFPIATKKEMIRADEEILITAFRKVLSEYIKIR